MIAAILSLAALLEVALGAAVIANGKSSIHELLGIHLVGFGILTFAFAGLQRELRKARLEAARERHAALEERQARAAFDLKRRSGIISSIDRQQIQTVAANTLAATKADGENAKTAAAVKPSVVRPSRQGDPDPILLRLQTGSAHFRAERRWKLLTSCAGLGYLYSPPVSPKA